MSEHPDAYPDPGASPAWRTAEPERLCLDCLAVHTGSEPCVLPARPVLRVGT